MKKTFIIIIALTLLLSACQGNPQNTNPKIGAVRVLVVESFLADITQTVAGDRLKVETLMPLNVDPHAFEPTPKDVARISDSQLLVINGAGFESWIQPVLENAGGQRVVVEASKGLISRQAREGEAVMSPEEAGHAHPEGDPHFWLNPLNVIKYVENIRDGLIQVDPDGKPMYTANAEKYITELKNLDQWIADQVKSLPVENRKIVTNHESFGYYADQYGFTIIGTIMPSVSTESTPSAQQLARLIDQIHKTGVKVIFLETGTNPDLAAQISKETGVKVVTELYTHSITEPTGKAPSYLAMMRYNTQVLVEALK
jgi:ABC-type Zn uptake system ZnuABC Zn-binding protein ZnuA